MSQCKFCGSPDFTLNRESGDTKCSNCGTENYVGSPSSYTPLPEFKYDRKTGNMERTEYFPNSNFSTPSDSKD